MEKELEKKYFCNGVELFDYTNKNGQVIPSVNIHLSELKKSTNLRTVEGRVNLKSLYMKRDVYEQYLTNFGILTLVGQQFDILWNRYGQIDKIYI